MGGGSGVGVDEVTLVVGLHVGAVQAGVASFLAHAVGNGKWRGGGERW